MNTNTNKNNETSYKSHWARQREVSGAVIGISIILFFYKIFGRILVKPLLFTVVFFYYLFCREQKANSKKFLKIVSDYKKKHFNEDVSYSSLTHFMSFSDMVFDKVTSWMGEMKLGKHVIIEEETEKRLLNYNEGRVFLCSHLGNVEALRAINSTLTTIKVNAIVFTKNAKKFNHILKKIAPNSNMNLIVTQSIDANTAIELKQKVDNGEIVAIVGDRIPVNKGRNQNYRTVKAKFLDRTCEFPEGPFILASILRCKVQLIFGLKHYKKAKGENYTSDIDSSTLEVICEEFAAPLSLSRKNRESDLEKYVSMYASRLEHYTLKHPYQWFNFFDFFSDSDN